MDRKKLKEHIANHAIVKNYLPQDFNATFEKFFEIAGFHYNVYHAMEEVCLPKLRAVVKKHYPDLTVVHPVIEEYVNEVSSTTIFSLAYMMKGLVRDMKDGVDIQAKYPKLEEWRDFYVHPKPSTMEGVPRNLFLYPDDEQWAKYVEEENRELYRFFCWEEKRKTDFYDIVQPELFKVYPVLEELEGDFWVLYAVNLRDEYEEWLTVMESTESAVQYEMPPESVRWDNEKYYAEKSARYAKYSKNSQAKREAMIKSFEITI